MRDPSTEPTIVIPAGLPIEQAAAWVGRACWTELRLYEVLAGWLAVEADPETSVSFWGHRADAGDRAEAWRRRLPELREFPRGDFVVAASPAVVALFDRLDALDAPEATVERSGALAAVLRGVRLGYHHRRSIANGPADGPVAETLADALRSTFEVSGADADPAWIEAVGAVGDLP